MTQKFKAGDKVVATERFQSIKAGDVCTFDRCLGTDMFSVKEHPDLRCWDIKWQLFEPAFTNMKFRVNSPEHSKEIQEALFEMGFCWRSHGYEVRFADSFPPCDYLYTDTEGHLWRIDSEEDYLVSSFKSAQEFTVQTTKSYKLIPVETPKETITIDGKTYDKEAVLKRLAELEEVK